LVLSLSAKVHPSKGSSISKIDELLDGIIKEVNPAAEKLGVKITMAGRVALGLL
jgi:uncharacterized protein YunC (DUF1805 family)